MGFHFDGGLPVLEVDTDALDPFDLGKGGLHMDLTAVAAHPAYSIAMFHDLFNVYRPWKTSMEHCTELVKRVVTDLMELWFPFVRFILCPGPFFCGFRSA